MMKLPPFIFRDMEMFQAMLAGRPLAELANKYEITIPQVQNLLRRFVRNMYHYFREHRPEIDFSRYCVQVSPRTYLKHKEDWEFYIELYERYCRRCQAANSTINNK